MFYPFYVLKKQKQENSYTPIAADNNTESPIQTPITLPNDIITPKVGSQDQDIPTDNNLH